MIVATTPGTEVAREEWPQWCKSVTAARSGCTLTLRFVDDALGEIQLSDDKAFVGIDHEELGSAVAFTIRYGDGVLPMRYVIAEPQSVRQTTNESDELIAVDIVDSTNRRTFLSLA